jgi:serine/threonine-protein kinase
MRIMPDSSDGTDSASTHRALDAVAWGVTAAYATGEEARAFLQRRLVRLAKVAVFLILAMSVLFNARRLVAGMAPRDFLLHRMNFFGAAQLAVWAAIWWLCAGPARSLRTLRWIDGAGFVGFAAMTAPMALVVEGSAKLSPETANMSNSLALLLILRAVFVPSTWQRTAIVNALAIIPATVVSTILYRRYPELSQSAPLVNVVGWFVAFAFVATVVSGVIFGLRRQAHDAKQLGQYGLEAKIGEGGMGAVYRASHGMLRRKTAVKLLPPDKMGEESIARFEREVQLTAQLTHPNTVEIYDYGRTPEGVFYYAMELLDGLDLEQLVALDGPQPPDRVVFVLRQVCGALAEAHEAGLIHRDIKPANIILCERGGTYDVAKVVDFGLVKRAVTANDDAEQLSNVNVLTGTPLYLSPEAITDPDSVDGRSDIYALGAVAFFMLTGEPPFEGKGVVEVCSHHLHTQPDPPSERADGVDPEMDELVLRCLAKDPDDRFHDAIELRDALDTLPVGHAWTEARARAWWEAHETESPPATTTDVSASLVVDLQNRA